MADGHLGKLARDLRLLGFDVVYDRDAQDRQLL
ncbi:MAG: twitching motility protein PilT, partial [Verrucomicrobia bacterium]